MTTNRDNIEPTEGLEVAVIGMSGRFPGASDVDEYWQNLCDGVESIRQFTEDELKVLGVSPTSLRDPSFVKAGAILDGIEKFDARFFGYSPKEASIIDIQQRVFLECAWQTLEQAGYSAEKTQSQVGVFAGASMSTYLLDHLLSNKVAAEDAFEVMIGNDKDFLASRVSYELNLTGPSICVQTACSTSLVAVHLACQSLLSYQCDMALAGGVSIQAPKRAGYLYIPGGVSSPDGHCRAFDASAQGTVFGSGVGVVALKRLADALSDNDTILAVIKGAALSNDGSSKIGYTAPSVEGQAQAITMAQLMADVDVETITYIEAHGTGTALGDPVEIAALTKAFRATTDKKNFCAIGSVKTNIGHLDAAAGVAGLIKTILALMHKKLPPSLHFQQANPQIDFANSPFYVNTQLQEWKSDSSKLRAGVSSFGVGGTNAHVVLEEAPETDPSGPSRKHQLIVVSAKTETALEAASRNLAQHLRRHQEENLADVAYTLQFGRKRMSHRRMITCREAQEAIRLLESNDPERVLTANDTVDGGSLIFMFPGGGAQYVNMGLGLYQTERVFRREVDRGCDLLKAGSWYDLRDYLYPTRESAEGARREIKRPSIGLPALFVIEYAMARQLEDWGVRAEAMIGHSLGEYVAACLAGVFSLEDTLNIVRLRGELFETAPKGGMVSVWVEEEEALRMIGEELSIAAVNGPQHVVVSGEEKAIEAFCQRLERMEVEHQRIQIEVAAHSPLVERILDQYEEYVGKVVKNEPIRKFVSNVSGTWIKKDEATDERYWRRQLRETVRFKDGVRELIDSGAKVMLELGPGQTLRSLVNMQKRDAQPKWVIGTIRHPQQEEDDEQYLTEAVGKLWMAGIEIDWNQYHQGGRRRRIALPTYPFERQKYWVESIHGVEGGNTRETPGKLKNIKDWFYSPEWRKKDLCWSEEATAIERERKRKYIVLEGGDLVSRKLIEELRKKKLNVITARVGESYRRIAEKEFEIRTDKKQDYEELLKAAEPDDLEDVNIVHMWSLDQGEGRGETGNLEEHFSRNQWRGFYSLLYLAQAIEAGGIEGAIKVSFVSRGMQEVESRDSAAPEIATALGACKVIGQELETVRCRSIDIAGAYGDGTETLVVEQLINEIESDDEECEVAFRGKKRYVKRYEKVSLDRRITGSLVKNGGVYVITGGTGGIGIEIAEYLCKEKEGKAALVSRKGRDGISEEKRNRLKGLGDRILVEQADVSDEDEMRTAIERIEQRFGRIDGLIHMAGLSGESAVRMISEASHLDCDVLFKAKAQGLYVLSKILQNRNLDFCLLFSSNASILGGIGLSCYSAANIFMDAFACRQANATNARWISANWDGWLLNPSGRLSASFQTSLDQYAMTLDESLTALENILLSGLAGQIIVSTGDLSNRLETWTQRGINKSRYNVAAPSSKLFTRPPLATAYAPASTEVESVILEVWQDVLGIDQLGVHDNFFDLGGNSLIGLKIISRLKKELKLDIPVIAIFEGPTVSALAKILSKEEDKANKYEQDRLRGERRSESMRRKRVRG